jgi:hypothetical protein
VPSKTAGSGTGERLAFRYQRADLTPGAGQPPSGGGLLKANAWHCAVSPAPAQIVQ